MCVKKSTAFDFDIAVIEQMGDIFGDFFLPNLSWESIIAQKAAKL